MATKLALKRSRIYQKIFNVKHPFIAHDVGVSRVRTKIQVSICCKARIFSSMAASQAEVLAADLNPLGSVDARRVERSSDEPKTSKFARWRVLKIATLACVIKALKRREISSRFNRGRIRSQGSQRVTCKRSINLHRLIHKVRTNITRRWAKSRNVRWRSGRGWINIVNMRFQEILNVKRGKRLGLRDRDNGKVSFIKFSVAGDV